MATLQEQRDALAKVVKWVWDAAIEGALIDPAAIELCMMDAGLTNEAPANDDESEQYGVEVGSTFYRLTRLGHDALDGVK